MQAADVPAGTLCEASRRPQDLDPVVGSRRQME
jgi:hypothetical protein